MAEILVDNATLDGSRMRTADVEVRAMLLNLVQSLVDAPDKVDLLHVAEGNEVAFQLRTTPEDAGKLIGKNGRTARAIRVILNGSGMKNGRVYTFDLVHQQKTR